MRRACLHNDVCTRHAWLAGRVAARHVASVRLRAGFTRGREPRGHRHRRRLSFMPTDKQDDILHGKRGIFGVCKNKALAKYIDLVSALIPRTLP